MKYMIYFMILLANFTAILTVEFPLDDKFKESQELQVEKILANNEFPIEDTTIFKNEYLDIEDITYEYLVKKKKEGGLKYKLPKQYSILKKNDNYVEFNSYGRAFNDGYYDEYIIKNDTTFWRKLSFFTAWKNSEDTTEIFFRFIWQYYSRQNKWYLFDVEIVKINNTINLPIRRIDVRNEEYWRGILRGALESCNSINLDK